MKSSHLRLLVCGLAAGAVNGLLGTGGGMVLVPLLSTFGMLEEREIFPASVGIIFPICIISMLIDPGIHGLPWKQALPYLLTAIIGGLLAGKWENKIPVKWLHRVLGFLILVGGVRYLC